MRLLFSLAVFVVAVLLDSQPSRAAGTATEAERLALVAAHVGTARALTVGELEARLFPMPRFQRATLGETPDAIRHRMLEVVVRETLVSLAADREGFGRVWPSSYAVDHARSTATIRALRARLGAASSIPMADVEAYYDANRARYEAPPRYQIWRILCKTRDEAQTVLDLAAAATPKAFADLAREHSLDMATRLRGGNVGFVADDGSSNEPGLRVDPAIVRAAASVADGQLVPHPVAEGDAFAVVWRRGTLSASKRTVEAAAAQIREALWSTRLKTATDALVGQLRAAKLRDLNAAALDELEVRDLASTSLPLTR